MSTAASRLLETARRGELHHAIILHGPAAPVLRDLAVRVAKTLNCQNGSTGDDCVSCLRIDRRMHPDVHFAEVGGEKKLISIEQIRDIVSGASLRPYEGRNKVFIIDPADALSVSGSNALLKTLEEPTRNTTFILITRSPDLLLPTIRSRSQSIYIADPDRVLTGPPEITRLRQVSMVEDAGDLAGDLVDLLHRYANGESAALLTIAALIADRDDVKDALALLGAVLCDVAALDLDSAADPGKLAAIRGSIPRERLLAAADAAMGAIRWLGVNADARLLTEQVVATLAS